MLSIVRPAGSELCHFSALGPLLARWAGPAPPGCLLIISNGPDACPVSTGGMTNAAPREISSAGERRVP
jgi:hypothetical protein